jgi:hypothetical protein
MRRSIVPLALAVAGVGAVNVQPVDSTEPSVPVSLPAGAFHDVILDPEPVQPVAHVVRPSATAIVHSARTVQGAIHGIMAQTLRGFATWYCVPGRSICPKHYPGGNFAAAGPELRKALGPNWRGQYVTVSNARGQRVRVQLVDWCACGGGSAIDLFGAPFARLAPLSRGIVSVRIEWGA